MLGIVEVCLVLNLITMGLGMIFHILFGEPGTFQLKIYFVYLFVMTLPTLFFVLGVALIVANRVKNHALAVLVLLAVFAAFYFGTTDLVWGIVDPWGRALPLLFSDVTGMTRRSGLFYNGECLFFWDWGLLCWLWG
ncbi:MAG: hypothetical protein ACLU4N_19035 [Butyricimonas faecihominis]